MELYNTIDDDNVINKEKTLLATFPIKYKEEVDIVSPVIPLRVVDEFDVFKCNYCFLTALNRWYFITDINILGDNLYQIQLECDVLETYKDDILNSAVEYTRKIKEGEYYSVTQKTLVTKEIEIHHSDITLINNRTMIMSTIGVSSLV